MLRSHCEFFFSFPLALSINCCHPHAHSCTSSQGQNKHRGSPHATCQRYQAGRRGEERRNSCSTRSRVSVWSRHTLERTTKLILSLSPDRSQLPVRSRCLCYQVPLRQSRLWLNECDSNSTSCNRTWPEKDSPLWVIIRWCYQVPYQELILCRIIPVRWQEC